jgi:DNA-binding NtrC family response regulator
MKKKILIVGDDSSFLEPLTDILKAAGFCVRTASRDSEGVPCLSEDQIDLLVVDLTLPEQNGREVLDRAMTLFPLLPVILLTSISEQSNFAVSSGVLLEKPVASRTLLSTMARLLQEPFEVRSRRLASFVESTESNEERAAGESSFIGLGAVADQREEGN